MTSPVDKGLTHARNSRDRPPHSGRVTILPAEVEDIGILSDGDPRVPAEKV